MARHKRIKGKIYIAHYGLGIQPREWAGPVPSARLGRIPGTGLPSSRYTRPAGTGRGAHPPPDRAPEQLQRLGQRYQPVLGDLLRLQHDGAEAGVPEERRSQRETACRPGRAGRGRRKSTHTRRPVRTSRPHSSRTSRWQASHGVSPSASMTPPGIVHPDLYVGFRISRRPLRSKISAPADAGMAGRISRPARARIRNRNRTESRSPARPRARRAGNRRLPQGKLTARRLEHRARTSDPSRLVRTAGAVNNIAAVASDGSAAPWSRDAARPLF